MGNYVIEVGISMIVSPSQVGNCKIADTLGLQPERLRPSLDA
jgi:hypothetical protein